ncbi:YkgJ family cysteine cluster protein [Thermoproteota archaeon]
MKQTQDRFKCRNCGYCCTQIVVLSDDDLERIKQAGYDESEFVEDDRLDRKRIKMKNYFCYFLGLNKGETFCRIYKYRPSVCRIYPFFEGCTADIPGSPKMYGFGKNNIIIRSIPGVIGSHNYYADLGISHLYPIASNPDYRSMFEPGIGRGFYITGIMSLPNMREGTGIDINPRAINLTYFNLKLNHVKGFIDLDIADVREYMKKDFTVDLIVFDLPLIPIPPDYDMPNQLKTMIDGGPDGRKYIDFMIENSGPHIRKRGTLYFVQPDFSDGRSLDMLADNGFEPRIIAEKPKAINSTITTSSVRHHLEDNLGYRFRNGIDGECFLLQVIAGVKKHDS